MCFTERGIYTQEVLSSVMKQLIEQPVLPTLFMRTVIQALAVFPKLMVFVLNIMQRLITKQVNVMGDTGKTYLGKMHGTKYVGTLYKKSLSDIGNKR